MANERIQEFNPNKKLPEYMTIKNVNHLYKIGLIDRILNNRSNRKPFRYNPYLVLFINSMILIKSIISICNSNKKKQFFIKIGDFSYFIPGILFHWNIAVSLIWM